MVPQERLSTDRHPQLQVTIGFYIYRFAPPSDRARTPPSDRA